MKKTLNFLYAIAAFASVFSCAKMEPVNQEQIIPDGYSKVYFNAGVAEPESKAVINGTSIEWQGTEEINIWYKDAEGNVTKAAATIESFSGKSAYISAILPDDAPKDEFIAELNGVDGTSGKQPFGSSTSRARYKVATEQTAGANGFDADVFAMGARWKKTDDDTTPHFTFTSLCSMLKFTVTNNANNSINKVTLTCDNSIANSTYWSIRDDGSLSFGSSNNTVYNTVTLNANVESGETKDLYFVISAHSKDGPIKLENMKLTFEFTDERTRQYSNPQPLELGHSLSYIAAFTINEADLPKDESYYVPFGATWDYTCLAAWNSAGFVKGEVYAMSALEPYESAKAFVKANQDITYASKSAYFRGNDSYFEFYAAEAGIGVLTCRIRLNKSATNAAPSVCTVKKNDEVIYELTNTSGDKKIEVKQIEIEVVKGDKITVTLPADSNNENRFVFGASDANGGNTPYTWTRKE